MREKVAIVGSRAWSDYELIRDYVYSLDGNDTIVSGGAKGVDSFAEFYARERGLAILVFRADWGRHGPRAGLLRNHDIVRECDRLVAFWSNKSSGTAHSISLAKESGKPTLVFSLDSAKV